MIIDPYRRVTGADPLFSDVLLLLRGNGANNGSVFTDSSQYARTVTRINSDTFTSTTQSKFNGSSIRSSNNGSGFSTITIAEATGTNWCFDAQVRRDAAFARFGVFSFASGNVVGRIDGTAGDSSYKFRLMLSGAVALTSTLAVPSETWAHLRISCQDEGGGTSRIRLFVDGNLDDEDTSTDSNLDMTGGIDLQIGRYDLAGFYQMEGYLAEYRLTNATRDTASFTAQSAPWPDF